MITRQCGWQSHLLTLLQWLAPEHTAAHHHPGGEQGTGFSLTSSCKIAENLRSWAACRILRPGNALADHYFHLCGCKWALKQEIKVM